MADARLNLIAIRSSDLDRAVEFYRALGLQFTKHSHGDAPEHYTSEDSSFIFEIYPLAAEQLPTIFTRIGFQVASVDQIAARLKERGWSQLSAPRDSPWGRRAVFADSDGHRVELFSAPTTP